MSRTALMLFMSPLAIPAVASMRCGTYLVDEGDSVGQVLERCGQPLSRIVNEPALHDNGTPKLNAARTEFWVYGPSGGVYRHLRFIDGKLVEIQLERGWYEAAEELFLRIITNSPRNIAKEC